MNALAKPPQDDHLRFSPRLLLSRLEIDKLDCIEVDRQKRIVYRSRQFSHIPRLIAQEFVEGPQKPHIVDFKVRASSLRHDSYDLGLWSRPNSTCVPSVHEIYT